MTADWYFSSDLNEAIAFEVWQKTNQKTYYNMDDFYIIYFKLYKITL